MLNKVKAYIVTTVKSAADRGNPLAKKLVQGEMRDFISQMPAQSPIIRGPYEIEDLGTPLDGDDLMGDYALVPLDPVPVTPEALIGRLIAEVSVQLGSYGMGGYGFLGLQLENQWLIVPIFGAGSWVSLDGRMVEAHDSSVETWIVDGDDRQFTKRLVGAQIETASLRKHGMKLTLSNGAVLEIADDPTTRPAFPGDSLLRAFLPEDDLAAALFFSPSGVIYA
ncbi:MAG: hypothetical protein N4A61_15815 [Pelagimonas sp.]|jgi:hypothetical protein|nr:hypothetical protein [Pelagimonas sp.]